MTQEICSSKLDYFFKALYFTPGFSWKNDPSKKSPIPNASKMIMKYCARIIHLMPNTFSTTNDNMNKTGIIIINKRNFHYTYMSTAGDSTQPSDAQPIPD